jgi:hypothetical protein
MDDVQLCAVAPPDIALLVGLPLTLTELEADIARRRTDPTDGRGDFGWSETLGGRRIDLATAQMFDDVQALLETARRAGVPDEQVYPKATLDSLSEAVERGCRVVILLAHWKGALVSSQDLADGAREQVLGVLQQSKGGVCIAFREFCSYRRVPTRASELAQLLNDFIKSFGGSDETLADAKRRTVRDALDAQFVGVLAPGNGVELRDAIHKPALLDAALAPEWSGIGDLAVCHSMALAEWLRNGRQDRRFIANAKPKFLVRVLAELREALKHVGHDPKPWVPLRAQISADYDKLIGGLAYARH